MCIIVYKIFLTTLLNNDEMHKLHLKAIKAENGKCHQSIQVMQQSLQVLCRCIKNKPMLTDWWMTAANQVNDGLKY